MRLEGLVKLFFLCQKYHNEIIFKLFYNFINYIKTICKIIFEKIPLYL